MFLLDVSYSASEQTCVIEWSNHIFLNVTFFMSGWSLYLAGNH